MWLFDFFKKKPAVNANADNDDMEMYQKRSIELMTMCTNRLIRKFNDKVGGRLDYSEASIEILDREILDYFSKNKENIDADAILDIIDMAGPYIFEVARRKYGGYYYWSNELNQAVLEIGQLDCAIAIIASDQVRKRIENGEEYNVALFFASYVQYMKQGVKERTLFVW